MTQPIGPSIPPSAFRAHAAGLLSLEAATELLLEHRTWLHRSDFAGHFINLHTHITTGAAMASVDWPAAVSALHAGQLPCSGSEASMLKIAASLAEGIPVSLRGAVTGLDETNTYLVVAAVIHTAGHQRGHH